MTMRVTGGLLRGRRLRVAGSTRLRPTSDRVRGAIFSILGPDACVGAKVLDLYAGTGMLGIEALSRGAESAVFVEVDSTLVRRMRDNLREMSVNKRALVVRGRVERVLDDLDGGYDLVFADPPYRDEVWDELMDRLGKKGAGERTRGGSRRVPPGNSDGRDLRDVGEGDPPTLWRLRHRCV